MHRVSRRTTLFSSSLKDLSLTSRYVPRCFAKQKHLKKNPSALRGPEIDLSFGNTTWDSIIEPKREGLRKVDNFFDSLTASQKSAVLTPEKVVRVIAGPGSGKTRVLVARAASILSQGVAPRNLMILTFTNKAAREMLDRLNNLAGDGDNLKGLWSGTFHSTASRLLRQYSSKLKDRIKRDFQILDASESKDLLLDVLLEENKIPIYEDDSQEVKKTKRKQMSALKRELTSKTERLYAHIAHCKELLPSVHGLRGEVVFERYKSAVGQITTGRADFVWAFDLYQSKLQSSNYVDFGDLMSMAVWLLANDKEVLEECRERFKFVFVDEMQDTNRPQYEFLRLMMGQSNRLFTVGDPNQGIYRFRGAQMENMSLEMEKDFREDLKTKYLLDNFRSAPDILARAAEVLQAFVTGSPYNEMTPIRTAEVGDSVRTLRFVNHLFEAEFVAKSVNEMHEVKGIPWDRIAVLYRVHSLSKTIEEKLHKAKIPHFVRGRSFWDRSEIKNIVCYLRFLAKPWEIIAFERIYNKPPRGVGEKSLSNLKTWCKNNNRQFPQFLVEDLIDVDQVADEFGEIEIPKLDIPKEAKVVTKAREGIHQIRQIFVFLRSIARRHSVGETILAVLDKCGYREYLESDSEKSSRAILDKLDNIESLIDTASELVDGETKGLDFLGRFVDEASLMVDKAERKDKSGVQLMTVHAAKGLEFKAVYLVGCEEGILPIEVAEGEELTEEARLMFVAMTRAEDHLFLSWSGARQVFGKTIDRLPSRFLVWGSSDARLMRNRYKSF